MDLTTLVRFDEAREELTRQHKCACDLCVAEKIAKCTGNQKLLEQVKKSKSDK